MYHPQHSSFSSREALQGRVPFSPFLYFSPPWKSDFQTPTKVNLSLPFLLLRPPSNRLPTPSSPHAISILHAIFQSPRHLSNQEASMSPPHSHFKQPQTLTLCSSPFGRSSQTKNTLSRKLSQALLISKIFSRQIQPEGTSTPPRVIEKFKEHSSSSKSTS